MILQTDRRLPKAIHKYGCYFMCFVWYANKLNGAELSPELIIWRLAELAMDGAISKRCFIEDPDAVFEGVGVHAVYTGVHEPPHKVCTANQIEILRWETPKGSPHFVGGDGSGHVTYDPMGESRTVRIGRLESKRIFNVYPA